MADRQLLLAKQEVTPGTDAAPAAVDTVWVENVRFKPEGSMVRGKPATPGQGQVAGHMVGQHGTVEFDVPLAASGTAGTAPKWGVLAKACGNAETVVAVTSVTYAPMADTSAAPSLTLQWNEGRRKHVLTFSRGVMTLKGKAGDRPMLHFKFKGVITEVTTRAALVAGDADWTGWNDAKPWVQGRTVLTFAGQELPLYEFSLDHNDRAKFTDVPGQENVLLVGPREVSGSIKAGTPLPSTLNLETLANADTVSTLSIAHMVGQAGKIVTINARFQNELPDYVDEGGEDAFTAALGIIPSVVGGADDYSIVLT